ncbi:Aminoacyl-tRNA synthetase, class 1a, anticodon-binding [Artemisia annua]|uniref:valine--tRNA ligase n=1 Tax=Artemisia annua TaxID=35608 RepID=A0A2U1LI31_ARTAN|nr:Aminoacyl-tRNA synthetase, class 1a, anticodon-binding [Artemisia annua]
MKHLLKKKLVGYNPVNNWYQSQVYLHLMIHDKSGKKMSKSLGNVIDPIDVIQGITLEDLQDKHKNSNLDPAKVDIAKQAQRDDFPNGIQQCGTDALRFSLISDQDLKQIVPLETVNTNSIKESDKINLDVKRVYGYRKWCNKIWHATRFAISKLGDDYTPPTTTIVPERMPFSCQWILSYQLCDTFIEVIKPYFSSDDPSMVSARGYAQDTLWTCLDYGLRLLHPFMPFITEELWQRLPAPQHETRKNSIMLCEYPSAVESWTNEEAEYEMRIVESAVKSLRSIQEKEQVNERLAGFAVARTDNIADILRRHEKEVLTLATLSSLTILTEKDAVPPGCKESIVNESLSVYLKLQRAINVEKEREKLQTNLTELQNLSLVVFLKWSREKREKGDKMVKRDMWGC